jgi:integral membrane protein (TIGR01906 family)
MKKISWAIGILGSITFIVALFLTSFQFVLYSDIGFYEEEYSKYEVLDDVKMEMKDVLYVTEEMMDYLIDNREDLVVNTIVDGKEREFFNEREKIHMADVKKLFMAGLMVRRVAFIITILSLLLLIYVKADMRRILPRAFQLAILIFGVITGASAFYISKNFSTLFIQFHLLFFDNDYWILDPKTDLMINILPEGFFYDVVKTIGATFGFLLSILLIVSVIISVMQLRKRINLKK